MNAKLLLLVAVLLAVPACAKKDGPSCAIPEVLQRPMLEGPTREQPRRLLPIASYRLAISWSPQFCDSRMTSPAARLQCGGEMGQFGFTLHGLWPDGPGEQWPQYCKPTRLVSEKVVRENLCSTPSAQLIQHEWEKHGTCVSKTPEDYFPKGERLYRALKYPDMAKLRGKPMSAQAFQEAFAAANPGMKADQMKLNVTKDGWLDEIWFCLDTKLNYRTCAANQGGEGPTDRIRIR